MILTNQQIFKYSQDIVNNFSKIDKYYPAKFNFYLQKNLKALMNGVDEIEQSRNKTIQHYGEKKGDNEYFVPPEKIEVENAELQELLSIQQDVDIYMLKLQDIEELEFTPQQMEALMFMIEE